MFCPILTIIVPCYNEEAAFSHTKEALSTILHQLIQEDLIDNKSKILFVDDGSGDQTWELIQDACRQTPTITGLRLSKNFGHQKALLAGLTKAVQKSDCLISIDADLQDDVQAIPDFVKKYHEGHDIVYGVRNSRESDGFFKKWTAQSFYQIMAKMGMSLVYNHADYRLMSKRAVIELLKFKESHLFLRGIVPLVGFPTAKVSYERKERVAGHSKYPLKKMISFALDGMTSFSIKPIRIITLFGFLVSFISFVVGLYALFQKALGQTELGWTSLIMSIWFIGGVLLISIGLVGEYIGKIYEEVKQRPRFIIQEDLFSNQETYPIRGVDRTSLGDPLFSDQIDSSSMYQH